MGSIWRWAAALATALLWLAAASVAGAEDSELTTRRDAVRQWRHTQLLALAKSASAKQYATLARRCVLRAERLALDPDAVAAQKERIPADDGAKLSAKQRSALEKRFGKLRTETAKRLAALAAWCGQNGHADAAHEIATEALRHDSGNKAAHGALGNVLVKGWGWIPAADAKQMKKGLLPHDGGWRKRAEVVKLRAAWDTAWDVRSPHWHIRSNLELERVFALRDLLEALQAKWMAEWDGYLPLRAKTPLHRVHIFARKAAYEAHIEKHVPNHTKGVPGQYSGDAQGAFFYDVETHRGNGNQTSSLQELMLHECTHQLFRERVAGKPGNVTRGDAANFWLHEGIAEYYGMLSPAKGGLVWNRGYMSGLVKTAYLRKNAGRMQALTALDALRRDGYMTRDGDQRNVNYAQSGFLCLFLDDGPHRPGLRKAVRALYCGKNEPEAIARLVTPDMDALQKGFDRFFKGL